MATIAENLQRIETAKSDIRTAIINKGVDVPSGDTIDSYASKIDSISTGTNLKLKDVQSATYTANGSYSILPDSGYDGMAKVNVEVNVPQKEEQGKTITITSNGTTTVSPDEGKVLSSVTITTNVASTPSSGWDGQYAVFDNNVTFTRHYASKLNYIEISFNMTTSGSVFTTDDGSDTGYGLSVDSGNNWTFSYYEGGDGEITRRMNIGQLAYNGLDMHFIASFKDYSGRNINLTLTNSNGLSITKTINNSDWEELITYDFFCPFYVNIDATTNTKSSINFKLRYLKLGINGDYEYWVNDNQETISDLVDLKSGHQVLVTHWDGETWRKDGKGLTSSYY